MKNLIIFAFLLTASIAVAQKFEKKLLENKWLTISVNVNKAPADFVVIIEYTKESMILEGHSTPYKFIENKISFNPGNGLIEWEVVKLTKKQLFIRNEDKLLVKMKKI
jgi:hypothetical protein